MAGSVSGEEGGREAVDAVGQDNENNENEWPSCNRRETERPFRMEAGVTRQEGRQREACAVEGSGAPCLARAVKGSPASGMGKNGAADRSKGPQPGPLADGARWGRTFGSQARGSGKATGGKWAGSGHRKERQEKPPNRGRSDAALCCRFTARCANGGKELPAVSSLLRHPSCHCLASLLHHHHCHPPPPQLDCASRR